MASLAYDPVSTNQRWRNDWPHPFGLGGSTLKRLTPWRPCLTFELTFERGISVYATLLENALLPSQTHVPTSDVQLVTCAMLFPMTSLVDRHVDAMMTSPCVAANRYFRFAVQTRWHTTTSVRWWRLHVETKRQLTSCGWGHVSTVGHVMCFFYLFRRNALMLNSFDNIDHGIDCL